MTALEIIDRLMIGTGPDNARIGVAKFEYNLGWMALWHAEVYIRQQDGSFIPDAFEIHRKIEGSATRAICFPNFRQKQIELIK